MKRQAMMVESVSPGESDGRYAITIAATSDIGDGNPLDIEGMNLERYLKNPVVLWSHDAWTMPIGQTLGLERTGGKLRAEFEFPAGRRVRGARPQRMGSRLPSGCQHRLGERRDAGCHA